MILLIRGIYHNDTDGLIFKLETDLQNEFMVMGWGCGEEGAGSIGSLKLTCTH